MTDHITVDNEVITIEVAEDYRNRKSDDKQDDVDNYCEQDDDEQIARILSMLDEKKETNEESDTDDILDTVTDTEFCAPCGKSIVKKNKARHRKSLAHERACSKIEPKPVEIINSQEYEAIMSRLNAISYSIELLMKKEIIIKCVS